MESYSRPTMGNVGLLIYRECAQGCWCATGEGELAPLCAKHRRPMLPGGGPAGMFGPEPGDPLEARRMRSLGFAALFGYEMAMVDLVQRVRCWTGMFTRTGGKWAIGSHRLEDPPRAERYFTFEEIHGKALEGGWDGEKWGDGS